MDRLVSRLYQQGHEVTILGFDAATPRYRPFGVRIPDELQPNASLFFQYVGQVEAVRSINVRRADLVISTQPPSFHVDHPRHLGVFYHHLRPFYDLAPYMRGAGMFHDEIHSAATAAVRRIDQPAIEGMRWLLAGSEAVAERLRHFNGRVNQVSVFHAGPNGNEDIPDASGGDDGTALCVSRHDFPKRTELFAHAARLNPDIPAVSVGVGGRLGWLMELDRTFSSKGVPSTVAPEDLWLHDKPWIDPTNLPKPKGNLQFTGAVSDSQLFDRYQRAMFVVAPALLEDYGLTVIEAMRHGKPVIACTDGGHLQHFVRDGVNGLLVEPTGQAIASAMRRLRDDPVLRQALGRGARETSAEFTWDRAFEEFDLAIAEVSS
jgi:glycosyltransferase involved in cell wall biosynthesis